MKPITLYTANCRGDASNSFYPNRRVIASAEDLKDAVQYDHVFAEYRNYHRAHHRHRPVGGHARRGSSQSQRKRVGKSHLL